MTMFRTQADKIVDMILGELNNRGGFDNWWDEIDPDIREEIREELSDIVVDNS